LGEELEGKFGAEVELLSSDGGVFEIVVDGSLLFSKKSLNRFPEEGEIPYLLEASRS
jgi:selT/selW/selH-like putative selenoprotein